MLTCQVVGEQRSSSDTRVQVVQERYASTISTVEISGLLVSLWQGSCFCVNCLLFQCCVAVLQYLFVDFACCACRVVSLVAFASCSDDTSFKKKNHTRGTVTVHEK